MDEITHKLKTRRSEGKWKGRCRAVVVHEDAEAHGWVQPLCASLRRELGERDFNYCSWEFEQLDERSHFNAALNEAVEAELIIISFHPGEQLARPVTHWVEAFAGRRRKPGALVAFAGHAGCHATEGEPPIHEYLREAAGQAGLEFWATSAGEMPEAMPESLDTFIDRASEVTRLLRDILHHGTPHP